MFTTNIQQCWLLAFYSSCFSLGSFVYAESLSLLCLYLKVLALKSTILPNLLKVLM